MRFDEPGSSAHENSSGRENMKKTGSALVTVTTALDGMRSQSARWSMTAALPEATCDKFA
jgi:hypothetical protein